MAAHPPVRVPGNPAPAKRYPGSRRVPLEWPGPGRPPLAGNELGRLSAMLLGFGPTRVEEVTEAAVAVITGRPVSGPDAYRPIGNPLRRGVPSGGAFHPGEVYLAWQGSPALAAGLYHYDPVHHGLELLRAGAPGPRLAAALGRRRDCHHVLLACRPWKNGDKYPFGYRLSAMDVGALVAQAEAGGAAGAVHVAFDSAAVDALLGLDRAVESVYAVVELSATGPPAATPLDTTAPVPPAWGLDHDRRTAGTVHPDAVALHRAALHRAALAGRPPVRPEPAPDDGTVTPVVLPLPVPAAADPDEAVTARRSAGAMRPGLRPDQLAGVLARIARSGSLERAAPEHLRLALWCAVSRVDGLPAGAYRYEPGSHTLRAAGPGRPVARELADATTGIATRLLTAGATIYAVAGPGADPSAQDPWSYRLLHLLCGAFVQRAGLAAAGVGAAARPVLSFVPSAVHALLGLDAGHTVVMQVHLGVPGRCPGMLSARLVGPDRAGPACGEESDMDTSPIPVLVDHSPRAVLDGVAAHGAVLVRGGPAPRESFHAIGDALMDPLRYENPFRAEREVVDGDTTTTTVTSGTRAIALHRESSYLPGAPDLLTFHCVRPAAAGGETTLCDGVALLAALEPGLRDDARNLRLVWETRIDTEQWQAMTAGTDPAEAVRQVRQWRDHLPPWQTIDADVTDGVMTIAFGTACTPPTMFGGVPSFCNSLLITDPRDGEYAEGRLRVGSADGGPVPARLLTEVRRVAESLTRAVPWRAGDTVVVDNTRYLHGRRSFDDPGRSVLVRMGYLRPEWLPAPAGPVAG
ncbi:TauD/TfdA family dioxygenase [Jidongwangia harbinensis]|uniref:TauD/TfdA family dioxygenase n=1 Tax=Jidongwangia harbinensis TaxID=2878561 RepID=UPI001CD9DB80|nr:TauD/TfdA family dioxygenase [Jidongwangia harbinensis]MCA2216671.1 TauD/TfdA family dioxygenase [Jidongwangia harbinensis]